MGSYKSNHGKLELLDLSKWTWETKQPYITDISRFATLYFDGSMYVFGGYTFNGLPRYKSNPLDTIRSYNPKTDTWTDRGKLKSTHQNHDVIYSSGSFLVLGDSTNHKSEKCGFNGTLLVCEEQETTYGSVE